MSVQPTVSVIMAVHNEADAVRYAVEAVRTQDYPNIEFVVVDDGSLDDSFEVLSAELVGAREWLLRNEKRQGLPAALNKAAAAAQGKYLARADADEEFAATRISTQVEVLERFPEIDVVASNYEITDFCGRTLATIVLPSSGRYQFSDFLENGVPFCHGSAVIRRTVFVEIGGYDERFHKAQDLDMWLRVAERHEGERFYVCPEILYKRRIDPRRFGSRKRQKAFAHAAKVNAKRRYDGLSEDRSLIRKAQRLRDKCVSYRTRQALRQYMISIAYEKAGEHADARNTAWRALLRFPFEGRLWYRVLKLGVTAIFGKIVKP